MAPPNVVVLVLDTARARNFSCYGHSRETSPNVDRIASEGVRYENAITNGPWTLPAHASLFTGRLPFDHGAHARGYQLDSDVPTAAEQLRNAGYETAIVSNNGWLSDGFGVLRGFERRYAVWKLFQTETNIVGPYREHVKHADLTRSPDSVLRFLSSILTAGNPVRDVVNLAYGAVRNDEYHHAGGRITRLLKRSVSNADGPFFVVANYLEPHLEYAPPERLRSRFLPGDVSRERLDEIPQDVYDVQFGDAELSPADERLLERLYDGEIAHVDEFVGEVYDFLASEGELDDTLLVIVGDHGENVGDHGLLGHNSSLHDTVLRVPLVVRPPGGGSGGTESAYVQLTDLYRTILTAADVDPPRGDDEFSWDLLGGLDERPEIAVAQYAGLQLQRDRILESCPDVDVDRYDRRLDPVYADGAKLVESSTDERRIDFEDGRAPDDPDRRSEIESRLDAIREEYVTDVDDGSTSVREVDAAVKTRLEDLGYHK